MTDQHIVDVLIAERAPKLRASPAWPLLRPMLYGLLGHAPARAMADAIAPMGGYQAMDHVSDLLHLDVRVRGLERVPLTGRLTIIANHPTGLADGVALYDAVKGVRPDLRFFANSDAHRVNPRLGEVFIPVEWVPARRTRERTRLTLALAQQAYVEERALAIFPAGGIALPDKDFHLIDPPWQSTAISMARKHDSPILPVHIAGPISWSFALLHRVSKELRDITLFHDLLNKAGKRFDVIFGPLVRRPETLDGDPAALADRLKLYVERILPEHPDRPFA